jgi:hypothetical protein
MNKNINKKKKNQKNKDQNEKNTLLTWIGG